MFRSSALLCLLSVGLDRNTLMVLLPPDGKYGGLAALLTTPIGQYLKDQSVLYVPKDFSPYRGPLGQPAQQQ